MLRNHFNAVESTLLAQARIPESSGHPLHKGTPRESFLREFLNKHLSETVAVGTGEVIHYGSLPNEKRNQIDIVVYRRDFPKLDFGGEVKAFLLDSVVATIEVKSNLTKEAMFHSADVARNLNLLSLAVSTRYSRQNRFPPGIMKYLVAYDGPEDMRTIYNWLEEYNTTNNIKLPARRSAFSDTISSPTFDTIVVLGKGFVHFDNLLMRFIDDVTVTNEPNARWVISNSSDENLLLLFMSLTWAVVNSVPSNELSVGLYMANLFSKRERYIGT